MDFCLFFLYVFLLLCIMTYNNETLSGFIPMRVLSGYGKDKEPYKEKSKDKKRKKDFSDARRRKRGEYDQ